MNTKILIVIVSIIFIFPPAYVILTASKTSQNIDTENLTSKIPTIGEFIPMRLCKKSGGEWKNVSATKYPLSEGEGVYNPTTDSEMNYKCFCPIEKIWNPSIGCV